MHWYKTVNDWTLYWLYMYMQQLLSSQSTDDNYITFVLYIYIPGGPKKRPELCVSITARMLSDWCFGNSISYSEILLQSEYQSILFQWNMQQ